MSQRLRVVFAMPDLQDVGVQRVVRGLLTRWDRAAFELSVLVHKREGTLAKTYAPDVPIIEVDKLVPDVRGVRIATRVLGYARAYRRLKPHAVLSMTPYSNLASVMARPLSGQGFGLVVSEHAHVTASLRDQSAFGTGFRTFYTRMFPSMYARAEIVKAIAQESLDDLADVHGVPRAKLRLVPDPLDVQGLVALGKETPAHPWCAPEERAKVPLISILGRLAPQKRHDLLLQAFALVRKERPARLAIVGRGPELESLRALARSLGVDADVAFLGFQENAHAILAHSEVFALSSDWEGLPAVLLEAMALGTPVVSTRCPSGPNEILAGGQYGLLVPVNDAGALARGLLEVLSNPQAAKARAQAGFASLTRFDPQAITLRYQELARDAVRLYGARTMR
ncbi:MAG: glycosyltransferase [Deltaproteobacteria bacterium]|nr:glycosyltransferase [Deltaproteobacteria bacterium]